jgi:hypothetical protein
VADFHPRDEERKVKDERDSKIEEWTNGGGSR